MGLLSETGDGRSGMHPAGPLMLVLDVACSRDLHYLKHSQMQTVAEFAAPTHLIVSPFLNDLITPARFN